MEKTHAAFPLIKFSPPTFFLLRYFQHIITERIGNTQEFFQKIEENVTPLQPNRMHDTTFMAVSQLLSTIEPNAPIKEPNEYLLETSAT